MKTPRRRLAIALLLALVLPAFAATGGDHPPKVLKQVPPHYTETMRKNRPKGEVIVEFVVDTKGAVAQAAVHKPLTPEADQAAVECVQKWTFEPAVQGGRPVNTRMRIPIRFN